VDWIPGPIQRKLSIIPIEKMMPAGGGYDDFEKRILKIFVRRKKGSKKNIMRLTDQRNPFHRRRRASTVEGQKNMRGKAKAEHLSQKPKCLKGRPRIRMQLRGRHIQRT